MIAVDFDGTLCEHSFPAIGKVEIKHMKVMGYCKIAQSKGAIIILWTCREGKYLDEAVKWCGEQGLIFNYINENCRISQEFCKNYYGKNSRKIFADEYIDDKAVNMLDI